MFIIQSLNAIEILDSRGRPTILTKCTLKSGVSAYASVPLRASTGRSEALELRDGDTNRYQGLGCQIAVSNVNTQIAENIAGVSFAHQSDLAHALILTPTCVMSSPACLP